MNKSQGRKDVVARKQTRHLFSIQPQPKRDSVRIIVKMPPSRRGRA